MSKNDTPSKEVTASGAREAELQQVAKRESRLKLGLVIIAVALLGIISLFVYNYIQARTGRPKSTYEFQLNTLKAFQDAVNKNPKDAVAHTNLGYAYAQMGKNGRAIGEFKKAVKYDSKNADAHLLLGRLYIKISQEDNAIPHLKEAAKQAPEKGKALAYFTLGEIYEEKKDLERAFDYYTKSSEDEPLMWNAHFKLGQFYERDDKKEQALAEYKEAEKYNPNNSEIKQAIERVSK